MKHDPRYKRSRELLCATLVLLMAFAVGALLIV
jgi:hypothetical protein